MPINYDQYQIANSQLVRPFAGSVLPEMTSVAGALQSRFDTALEHEDLLDRAVKTSTAAPFEQDRKLLSDLKKQYREKIQQRVASGDYENMLRDTVLDSRDFVAAYKPIAENQQAYEKYKGELQEAIAKGVIKDPAKAQRLLQASVMGYSGLQQDPETGTYTNRFSGIAPVADINPTEKVDKWMKDIAPTVLKSEVRYTDGVWRRFKEGKWTTLTQNEIDKVLDAGRKLDPDFNGWLNQEKQLSAVGAGNVDDVAVKALPPAMRAFMTEKMQQTGLSAREVIAGTLAHQKEQDVLGSMRQYASKYIRDDKETGSGILAADEYNLKKKEDEVLPLSMPILQPEARVEIKGAEDLRSKIGQSGQAVQAARQHFDEWWRTNLVRPNGKGGWVDDKGNDMTLKYLEQKQIYEQANHAWEELVKLDAEAKKRTGYGAGSVSPELVKKADKYLEEQGGRYYTKDVQENIRGQYLREHSPGYDQYDKTVKDMTARGAQTINVQTFNSKHANAQAEALFKGLALNLDASGLKAGTQGMVWASGDKAGEPLSADDYKKVAADVQFSGYGMDTDGQLKFYYKVGKVTQNTKGSTVGEENLVKIPALPGTTEVLLKSKQADLAQLALGQQINQTINKASGAGYIDIDGKTKIYVDRIDKTEIGKQEVASGINLRFPKADGTYTEIRVDGVGDAITTIINAMQNRLAREGTKQKK